MSISQASGYYRNIVMAKLKGQYLDARLSLTADSKCAICSLEIIAKLASSDNLTKFTPKQITLIKDYFDMTLNKGNLPMKVLSKQFFDNVITTIKGDRAKNGALSLNATALMCHAIFCSLKVMLAERFLMVADRHYMNMQDQFNRSIEEMPSYLDHIANGNDFQIGFNLDQISSAEALAFVFSHFTFEDQLDPNGNIICATAPKDINEQTLLWLKDQQNPELLEFVLAFEKMIEIRNINSRRKLAGSIASSTLRLANHCKTLNPYTEDPSILTKQIFKHYPIQTVMKHGIQRHFYMDNFTAEGANFRRTVHAYHDAQIEQVNEVYCTFYTLLKAYKPPWTKREFTSYTSLPIRNFDLHLLPGNVIPTDLSKLDPRKIPDNFESGLLSSKAFLEHKQRKAIKPKPPSKRHKQKTKKRSPKPALPLSKRVTNKTPPAPLRHNKPTLSRPTLATVKSTQPLNIGLRFKHHKVHARVSEWATHPFRALAAPKYAHVTCIDTKERIIREHTFPSAIDSFSGTGYSRDKIIDANHRSNFVAGTWNGKFVVFEYSYYKNPHGKWVLFHRWASFQKPGEFKESILFGTPSESCIFPKIGEEEKIMDAPKLHFSQADVQFEMNSVTRAVSMTIGADKIVLFKIGSDTTPTSQRNKK